MSSFGRNQISEVSVRLAHAISKTIPKEGKVLKIKKESMIINIGFRDGLKKGDTVAIGSEEKVYTVAEIINLDEFISEVVVKEKNTSWKKNIGEGYKVKKVKIVKVKKVKVNAEEAEE
ncbi:MAG: hypothetical protein KDK36_10830, partial [Leptospiraceae bacterium]|nr:hypothetical protein [Leptospiraceae bacterium]